MNKNDGNITKDFKSRLEDFESILRFHLSNLMITKMLKLVSGTELRSCDQTHEVEHVCPSLHGYALEDGEHGEQDVVKLGDTIVWSQPASLACCTIGTQPGRQHLSTR